MPDGDPGPRAASSSDVGTVVDTIAAAFQADPVWSWAFPDPDRRAEQYATWFGLFVESALPNRWVWLTGEGAAAAVWTPPGERELSEQAEARVEPFLRAELGAHAESVLQLMERIETACPKDRAFYYLSFLGTHPDHRGRGLGMGLLAANLASIDAEGRPAYLESTNPSNTPRYERLGFRRRAELSTPDGQHGVTTMWREGG